MVLMTPVMPYAAAKIITIRKRCSKFARHDGAACHGVGALAISTPMPVPKTVRMRRWGSRRFRLRKPRSSWCLASCRMMIEMITEMTTPARNPIAAYPRMVNRSKATSVAVSSVGSMQTTVAAASCGWPFSRVSECWPTRPAVPPCGGTAAGCGRRRRSIRAARTAPPLPGLRQPARAPPSRR